MKITENTLYAVSIDRILMYVSHTFGDGYGFNVGESKIDPMDREMDKLVFGIIDFKKKENWDCLDIEFVYYWNDFSGDYAFSLERSQIYHITKLDDDLWRATECDLRVRNNRDVYISKNMERLRKIVIKKLMQWYTINGSIIAERIMDFMSNEPDSVLKDVCQTYQKLANTTLYKEDVSGNYI